MTLPNLDITANTFTTGFFVNATNNIITAVNTMAANTALADQITALDASKAANSYVNTLVANTVNTINASVALKLDTTAYTATDILTKLLTVDGSGSGIDADLLDGQDSAYFQNASNQNAGTIPNARLSGNYTGITNLTASGTITAGSFAGSGVNISSVDAVTLNGQDYSYYTNIIGRLGYTPLNSTAYTGSDIASKLGVIGAGSTATFLRGDGTFQVATQYGVNGAFTKSQRITIVSLTSGSTVNTDFALSNYYTLTLAVNATLANPTNLVAGQVGSIEIKQDTTGSRTLAYGTFWKFPSGLIPALTTTANKVDRLDYLVANTTFIHCSMALNIGG